MMFNKLLCTLLLACWAMAVSAQNATVQGVLQDASTQKAVAGATLRLGLQTATTDEAGQFKFENVPYGTHEFKVADTDDSNTDENFTADAQTVDVNQPVLNMGTLFVTPSNLGNVSGEDIMPSVAVSGDDDRTGGAQNVSGILTASRDVFVSTTAFVFGPMRFRLRGYEPENMLVYMNGVPMNDVESGNPTWSLWGGLNDIMRGREIAYGLQPLSFTYGALGGGTNIDTRASKQRRQIRASYSLSNRMYNHRLMLTYNTGMLKNGWAFSFSGSRRWAKEGYIQGTFYDSWSLFGSAEKKIGKHSIALTALVTPTVRGGTTPTFQEMYDLAGSNFYNSQWGYQNGEKRNARVTTLNQPLFILTHEWQISEKSSWTTAASYQFGRNGVTALDWYDAADPRPDYYRYLPSYVTDPVMAAQVADLYRNNEAARQINWDNMYNVNRNSMATVNDANGVAGNTVTGNRAHYILSERRMDMKRFNLNSVYDRNINDEFHVFGGLQYQWESTRYFQVVSDLLGADYFVDIDRFAERDSAATNPSFAQNDLNTPNRIVKVGDTYGYDYTSQVHVGKAWGQGTYTGKKFDAFAAVELSNTIFWREGNMKNGRFPDASYGKSETQNFFNQSFKGGVTYKLNGRNYLFVNGSYMTRAPFFRDSYIAPRVRDQIIPGLRSEEITSFEGGYLLKSPQLNARAVAYFTQFNNQFSNRNFFLDNAIRTQDGSSSGGQVNYIMSNIDKQHAGLEFAVEGKPKFVKGLSLRAVAAIGEFIYTDRPQVSIFLDNQPTALVANRTVYIKNYYLSGTPQQAYTFGINYSGKEFYFLNLNFNYYRNNWIDINPDRHTIEALSYVADPQYQQEAVLPSSDLGQQILGQVKSNDAFTMDFFGGKSFRLKYTLGGKQKYYFIYLNAGVSNLLNNRNIMTWGFDQLRFDYETKNVSKFPTRLSYNFGANYFINLSIRL